jgi:hypothetical protein
MDTAVETFSGATVKLADKPSGVATTTGQGTGTAIVIPWSVLQGLAATQAIPFVQGTGN